MPCVTVELSPVAGNVKECWQLHLGNSAEFWKGIGGGYGSRAKTGRKDSLKWKMSMRYAEDGWL